MGLRFSADARCALRCYRGRGRATRTHVLGRHLSAPLDRVAAAVPAAGRVLDLGCGHGLLSLLLAVGSPGREVVGVDVDADKIAEADAAARCLHGQGTVRFCAVQPGWRPPATPSWDGIVICDVLYLLGPEAALQLVAACADALAPGGRIVIKEIDETRRWKYRLARTQELAATRLFKVTEGETVRFVPAARLAAALRGAGLTVERHRIDRGYPHAHLLLVGRKP